MKLKKTGIIFFIFLITISIPIIENENLDKNGGIIINSRSNNEGYISNYQSVNEYIGFDDQKSSIIVGPYPQNRVELRFVFHGSIWSIQDLNRHSLWKYHRMRS